MDSSTKDTLDVAAIILWNIMVNVICNFALDNKAIIFGGAVRDRLFKREKINLKKKMIDGDIDIMVDYPKQFYEEVKKSIKYYEISEIKKNIVNSIYKCYSFTVSLPNIFPFQECLTTSVKVDLVAKQNQLNLWDPDFDVNQFGVMAIAKRNTTLKKDFMCGTSLVFFEDHVKTLDFQEKNFKILKCVFYRHDLLDKAFHKPLVTLIKRICKMLERGWNLVECNNDEDNCLVFNNNFECCLCNYEYLNWNEEDGKDKIGSKLFFIKIDMCINCFLHTYQEKDEENNNSE